MIKKFFLIDEEDVAFFKEALAPGDISFEFSYAVNRAEDLKELKQNNVVSPHYIF